MPELHLSFGALAPKLVDQLWDQGLPVKTTRVVVMWQRMADAITLLSIQQVLTEAQVGCARRNLLKRIASAERSWRP